ncbi:MAG TPA: Uma2 family endonuclease [Bryobacteraceae bacterium]|nr:Uma2 family endonuclease [Bryobacteraceae bacterium]
MPTARALISVEEYLATVYEPDCDYVDGEVLQRNMGERDHSFVQGLAIAYFGARRKQWGITVLPEMRVQVKPTRFRIPDVCVVLGDTEEQILTKPPFLCIEILSPDDRWVRVKARINDFLAMGVPYIWVIDPQTKQAYIATPTEGLREVKDEILRTENPAFHVPLSELVS